MATRKPSALKSEWPGLNRERALLVEIGDKVDILALYNGSERPSNRLHNPCTVSGINRTFNCQTGLMFEVHDANGRAAFLSAAWFNNHQPKKPIETGGSSET